MPTKCQQEKKFAAMTICHCLLQYTIYMLSYQSESNGSCQKKTLRGFEKPSFQEIVSNDLMIVGMPVVIDFEPSSNERARLV